MYSSAFSPTNNTVHSAPTVELDVLSADRTADIHIDSPPGRVVEQRMYAGAAAANGNGAAANGTASAHVNGYVGSSNSNGNVAVSGGSNGVPVVVTDPSYADVFAASPANGGRSRLTVAAVAETRATGSRPVLLFKTPLNTLRSIMDAGGQKAALSWQQQFWLGVSSGAYIGIGGLLSIVVAGGLGADAKGNAVAVSIGLQRFVAGAVFPVGLMLVALTGGELCTGNMMVVTMAYLGGKTDLRSAAKNLFWSYLGNLAGSLVMAYFFSYLTDTVTAEPWLTYTQTLALGKVTPHWGRIFLKAMACNVLVGLAIWFSSAAEDVAGKILGIWWPIMTFVALGYEHSVANMFFIPLGMLNHSPGISGARTISVGDFIAHNLLPVTVGNLIGTILLNSVFFYQTLSPVKAKAPVNSNAAADAPKDKQQLVPV